MPDGSFVVVEIKGQTLTRISRDGHVSVIANLGGGPNGAAIGPDGKCYVCNNGGIKWPQSGLPSPMQPEDYIGGRIQRVNLKTGDVECLYDVSDGGPLRGPNDIVFDRHGGFWFTDAGKTRARDRDLSGIYYAKTDGSMVREVVFPMFHTNGIGLSPDESRLYVAETITGRIWAFDLAGPGEIVPKLGLSHPNGGTCLVSLPGYQGLDSLAIDAEGNICVATLWSGCITVISPTGGIIEQVATGDPITTNICFGGVDLKVAYITLSSKGQLVAAQWPRAGLPLNFLNQAH